MNTDMLILVDVEKLETLLLSKMSLPLIKYTKDIYYLDKSARCVISDGKLSHID